MSVLNINRIAARYSSNQNDENILENLSLQINDNNIVVILGPSGCGKTTLLNLIAGFTQPASGSIDLDGIPVKGPGAERGVIFQQNALLPWLKVIDNVAFGLQLHGVAKLDRHEKAKHMLKLVNLSGFEDRHIWELSGGMQQRVGLARTLASDPRILLMDEPFAALDALTREQMQTLLLKVWEETNKQILLITHDIEEAVFLATELVLMSPRPGRIVDRISLDFSKRFRAGESARHIKSDPEFIRMREQVLAWFFEQQTHSTSGSVH